MKGKKIVKDLLICVGIICITIIVDYLIQYYIYKNKYDIVEDDFLHVFQIDSIKQSENELVIEGWAFELETDSIEDDYEIILYDYNNDKEYYMVVDDKVREDVNEYFLCEYDYSNSGFVASLKLSKLDLENTNYEVLIRACGERQVYKSGAYISKGEMMYTEPESFVELEVDGTDLEKIVNEGVLRVYRPDVGMYVYQYNWNLYWIADESYEFDEDGNTLVQYQLDTTQIDRLPKHRLDSNNLWDNISFNFENKEILDMSVGDYRVALSRMPTEYSIEEIWTGYYVEGWEWKQRFRPWHKFD